MAEVRATPRGQPVRADQLRPPQLGAIAETTVRFQRPVMEPSSAAGRY